MAAKRVAAPAKLTPPRLLQSLPRERLFDWLDAHLDRRGIWLSGQPGAGKTMLTAGYLKARALPFIWYRLDAEGIASRLIAYRYEGYFDPAEVEEVLERVRSAHVVHPGRVLRRFAEIYG